MAKFLAKKTPVDIDVLVRALHNAWESYFGSVPSTDSVLVLVAQWALETGWGKSMYCYNLGNVKAGIVAKNYCYYACSEILSNETVNRWIKQDPKTAVLVRKIGNSRSEVRFYPENICCKFKAFETLEAGVSDFLEVLYNRFAFAWLYVCKGNPAGYAHALKQAHYYTADEVIYTKALVGVFNMLKKRVRIPIYSAVLGKSTSSLEDLEMMASIHDKDIGDEDLAFDSIEC